jgi:hypothetical protein
MATKLKIEKRGNEMKKKSSPLKLQSQSQPNFAEMILGWSPFKIVSVSTVLYPKIFFSFHSPFFLFSAWWPSWSEDGITRHNFGRGHPRIIPQKFDSLF